MNRRSQATGVTQKAPQSMLDAALGIARSRLASLFGKDAEDSPKGER